MRSRPSRTGFLPSILLFALVAVAGGAGLSACTPAHSPVSKAPTAKAAEQMVEKAEAFANAGETIRAEQYFSAALDMGAPPHQVLPRLVSVCVRAGRFRSAVAHAAPYLRQEPENVELRYLIATLYSGLGEARRAKRELELVLARDPRHTPALRLAGDLAVTRGDYDAAVQLLGAYLELEPNGPEATRVREDLAQIEHLQVFQQDREEEL